MKSNTEGDSFSNIVSFWIAVSFCKNCYLEYLLKQSVLTHVLKSIGSTSKFFEAKNSALTAVS